MANVFATKTGNWTDATVWNTGALPTSADDVYANGFTVTINTSPTVLSVRTTSASGINAGGGFTVSTAGLTLTADVYAGTTICVTSNVTTGNSFTVITQTGVCVGGSSSGAIGASNSSSGTVNITGNPTGGSFSSAYGAFNSSSGTVNITGNPTGGSSSGAAGAFNNSSGTVDITGNPTGGSSSGAHGASNNSSGTVNITGNPTGGSSSGTIGASNNFSGTVNITGSAIASAFAAGAQNSSSGVLRVTVAVGNGFGLGSAGIISTAAVISSLNSSLTYVQKLQFGARGNTPVSGPIILTDVTTNTVQFAREGGGSKTLVDTAATSGILPAASDVRSGVIYSSGNLTGTCAVPAADSVALGIAVDATIGTAVLTQPNVRAAVGLASANLDSQLSDLSGGQSTINTNVLSRLAAADYTAPPSASTIAAAVWAATSRTLTTTIASATDIATAVWAAAVRTITGGTVDTLTNAPNVPTAAQIAGQVRTELSTELARIDVATSTRLAPAGTLARVTLTDTTTTLTNAPDVPTEAEIATAVRAELSTELSRLDASVSSRLAPDGTLATVTTLTNAPDVPTPEEIAAEVWSATTREITGGTVDTLTTSPDVPTAEEIAAEVRTELATELARLSNASTTQEVADIVEGTLQS